MDAVFSTILPGFRAQAGLETFPRRVRVALTLSLLLLSLYTLLCHGRSFARLPEAKRLLVLEGLAHHRVAPIRGLLTWWKLMTVLLAC